MAVHDHGVAGLEFRCARRLDDSGSVNAAHTRKAADYLALAGGSQSVLEVDAGVLHAHRHIARVQVGVGQRGEVRTEASGTTGDQIGGEGNVGGAHRATFEVVRLLTVLWQGPAYRRGSLSRPPATTQTGKACRGG